MRNMAADSICTTPKQLKNNNNHEESAIKKTGQRFRATQFWNEAVDNLKTHIELKRKRMKMKWHDQCFSGSDAVDVVFQHLQHLQHEQELMNNKDVNRQNAVKLCQAMLENNVFEAVLPKPLKEDNKDSSKASQFEDSSTKLYKFLEDVAKENLYSRDTPDCSQCEGCEPFSDDDLETENFPTDGIICNNIALNKQGQQVTQELLDITGQWKKSSKTSLKKIITPGKLFKRTPSKQEVIVDPPRSPCAASAKQNHNAEDEIWREVALANLLRLVDIPLLDQILSYEHTGSGANVSQAGMTFSNVACRRWESVLSLLSDSSSIKSEDGQWMDYALDCLECIPQGSELLRQARSEETELTQRLRLFQSIADYYQSVADPLWSDKFVDLHVALYNLLMQSKRSEVLRALQLSIILLPPGVREELVRMLTFMKCACDDPLKLSSQEDNRSVIEKRFASSVIRNKVLAPHQCGQLVLFMMDHASKLTTCPSDVEDQVLARLEPPSQWAETQPKQDVAYCTRVSEEQYKKQSKDLTERVLVDLINSIIDDTSLPLKEKKNKIKLFHKHHTVLFEKHFSNLL